MKTPHQIANELYDELKIAGHFKKCSGEYERTIMTKAISKFNSQFSPMTEEDFKNALYKAFQHGESVGTFRMSSLPSSYAPLTFDSWFNSIKDSLFLSLQPKKENVHDNRSEKEGDEDKYEKGKFIISDPYIKRIKDKFSGSVDYMSGVNDGLYSMFYGLMGYTELVKILEKGLQGRGIDVRAYAEKYINDKPESVLVKPFKALLEGNNNPDKLTLLNQKEPSNKRYMENTEFENVIELIKAEIDSLKDAYKSSKESDNYNYSVRIVECQRAIKKLNTVPPQESNRRDGLIKFVKLTWDDGEIIDYNYLEVVIDEYLKQQEGK
jgi:hypothetical protein